MLWVPLTNELNSSANCKKLRPREPIKTFGNPQKLAHEIQIPRYVFAKIARKKMDHHISSIILCLGDISDGMKK